MYVHSLFTCPQPKLHYICLRFWSLIYFSAQGGTYILVLEESAFDQRIPTALSYQPLAMARCHPWFRQSETHCSVFQQVQDVDEPFVLG